VNPLRICLICNEYPPGLHGGIGSFTQMLGRALVRAGHSVRVLGLYRREAAQPACQADQGVDVRRLPIPRHPLGWVRAQRKMYKIVAKWGVEREVDLVEIPDWQGWAAGWPRLRIPLLARLHGSISYFAAEMNQSAGALTSYFESASLRRADFFCSVSRYTAERTQQLFGLPPITTVLYNPVDLPSTPRWQARSTKRVVFTGTLTVKKGVLSLAKAWPLVRRRFPEAELHIYGKDTVSRANESVQSLLESHLNGEGRSVYFHGHVERNQVCAALEDARVAVFPSYAEAFAMAPLEAMAAACPTIYSRSGSGPELIRDGQDGLLVNPDMPDEIANAICAVLGNDDLALRLGSAGQERIRKNFATEKILADNVNYYRECIARFQRSWQ
jgi:glycosyltransferase involved in cell wall biosynthesis